MNGLTDVNDLDPGDCITADGLTDADAESVTDIKTVSCSKDHDGEVLATLELTADQADNYSPHRSPRSAGRPSRPPARVR